MPQRIPEPRCEMRESPRNAYKASPSPESESELERETEVDGDVDVPWAWGVSFGFLESGNVSAAASAFAARPLLSYVLRLAGVC